MIKSHFKELSNLIGWHTKEHLIVIESDDWGSIRMPSKEVFNRMLEQDKDLLKGEGCRYNMYDSIATTKDISSLFEVLCSVKDSTGRSAIINPISVVANPDFSKILQSDFTEYYYEPFTDTLRTYTQSDDPFALWKEGINKRIFLPQFHGREHLNVAVWMRALKSKHKKTLSAFHNKMWGISTAEDPEIGIEFQAAFNYLNPEDIDYQKKIIITGLDLFEKIFGYRATYFCPPNGILSSKLEETCYNKGIRYLSTSKIQTEPKGSGKTMKRIHWLGQKGSGGLTYLVRNCFFEPNKSGTDWVNRCLKDISIAFKWHQPAIISSHRVNYIGSLHSENRDNGLKQLSLLLKQIIKYWPDIKFISSTELGEIIQNS